MWWTGEGKGGTVKGTGTGIRRRKRQEDRSERGDRGSGGLGEVGPQDRADGTGRVQIEPWFRAGPRLAPACSSSSAVSPAGQRRLMLAFAPSPRAFADRATPPAAVTVLRRRAPAPAFTPLSPIASPPPSPAPSWPQPAVDAPAASPESSDPLPTPPPAFALPFADPSASDPSDLSTPKPHVPRPNMASADPSPPPSSFKLRRPSDDDLNHHALFHLGSPESDTDDDEDDDGDEEFHDATSDGHVPPVIVPPPPKRKRNSSASRYYALLELLHTEARYLHDLRVLVNIYLELLPSLQLPTPKLSPSVSSHFLPRSSPSPTSPFKPADTAPADPRVHKRANSASSTNPRESKPLPSILSTPELDAVRRNARQLLDFHTAFLDRLRSVVVDPRFRIALDNDGHADAWSWEAIPKWQDSWEPLLNDAIVAVTTLFTTQASLFAVYEPFCSRQHDANEVVAKIATRHKDAWELYERRCADRLVLERDHRRRRSDSRPSSARLHRSSADLPPRSRRHSVDAVHLASSSDAAQGRSTTPDVPKDTRPRLKLVDYLVKPMQRVTRYPLLLAALLIHSLPPAPSSSSRPFTGPDVVVASARLAMDHVAAQIDAATSAQAAHVQSARIAARLAPAPHLKLASFVSTLGPCLLAAALDVLHHRALRDLGSGSVRAKYLAAFLYPGGFLVLAKVHGARRYEPRHWFDLAGFEIDGLEDSGLLPWSMRLYSPGAEFELACSCAAEKRVWMRALRDAAAVQPVWNYGEAPSSIVEHLLPIAPPELPPIPHASPMLEFANTPGEPALAAAAAGQPLSDFTVSPPATASSCSDYPLPPTRKNSRPILNKAEHAATPARETLLRASASSRRSSTVSVKAFFSTAAPDGAVIISRATPLARLEVDEALRDVQSEACADARRRAGVAGLFESAARANGAVGLGEAGVGMAGAIGVAARNRLRKRESLLVRRSVNVFGDAPPVPLAHVDRERASSVPAARLTVVTDRAALGAQKALMGSDEMLVMSPDAERGTSEESREVEPPVLPPKLQAVAPPLKQQSPVPPLKQQSPAPPSKQQSPAPPPPPPKIDIEQHSPTTTVFAQCDAPLSLDPAFLLPAPPRANVQRSRSMVDNVRGLFAGAERPPVRSASVVVHPGAQASLRRRVTDSLRGRAARRQELRIVPQSASASRGMLRALFSPFTRSSMADAV
ncbi:hypothetical protein K488DRAFT_68245 [Vararia minispora EC-137]|uniref:Uncharacterized protein n=1 Tax=Vararia minispora EC-137 TaxID=1314806 RepID=A0ACB8QUU3_9AGAM|nr:hypothetical protein K488DRAFT_68245 [Vararia minispora EC-137]